MTTRSPQPHSAPRRDFLRAFAAVGGGLALEFSFPLQAGAARGAPVTEVNAWVVIHPDDRVVVRIARSEMGQGTYTALAQLVAEELDCDWMKVSAEFASPNEHIRRGRIWGSMSTGGSQGVRSSQDYVRKAGAAAREMLVAAAAAQWKVPASECTVEKGVITHGPSKRRLRYGQVAARAAKLSPPTDIKLRDSKDWKIAGKPVHRLDIPDKVLGKPVFGTDVVLPGMLHASIAQCPVFGGKVKSVDDAAALGMRGVKKVVQRGGLRGGRGRQLVARQRGAEEGEGRVGLRRARQRVGRDHHGHAARGPRRPEDRAGEEGRRRCRGLRRRGEGRRGRIRLALPQSRHDGAAGVHRVGEAGRLRRGVDLHAERGGVHGRRGARRRACRSRRSRCTR